MDALVAHLGELGDAVSDAQWRTVGKNVLGQVISDVQAIRVLTLLDGFGIRIDAQVLKKAELRLQSQMKYPHQALQFADAAKLGGRFEFGTWGETVRAVLLKTPPPELEKLGKEWAPKMRLPSGPSLARLDGLAWAWLSEPDENVAGRLRAMIEKRDREGFIAVCEAAELMIGKDRRKTNRFFMEQMLKWPVCTAEQRRGAIQTPTAAGEFGPDVKAETLERLPRFRLAQRLGAKGINVVLAPVTPAGVH